ncbi:MAG: hypothetical protein RLZZ391_880 [Bacteroidota bacterium]|jgi:hypothetical protein
MQLNASTYETIFLLYIDNELSPKERLEVELWMAEHPSYALRMEELKATKLVPETMQFGWKANLKKIDAGSSKEVLEEDMIEDLETIWTKEYTNLLTQDMQAIPGLSKQFKNSLKKETTSKVGLLKAFGFSQNKFTYTAVAAMLLLFIGYKQLTTTTDLKTVAVAKTPSAQALSKEVLVQQFIPTQKTNENLKNSNKNQSVVQEPNANSIVYANEGIPEATSNVVAVQSLEKNESSTIVSPIELNVFTNNTTALAEKTVNSLSSSSTIALDAEEDSAPDTKMGNSYEVIDTEDPERTILIANFEIDGNRLRGLKRKVTSLFKNNKSDKNKK